MTAEDLRWHETVLSETQAKRQHYVPRSYLRRFAREDDQIRVVDLQEDREFRTSIGNAAVEGRFYDLENDQTVVSAEDWLARIESEASPVIEFLLSSPSSIETLKGEQEFALARFVAAFRFRTPAFRGWVDSMSRSLVAQLQEFMKPHLFNRFGQEDGQAILNEWKNKPLSWWLNGEIAQPAEMNTYMFEGIQGYANLLRAAPWRIGSAQGPSQLYTSDNPVSRYLPPIRPSWDAGAFSSFHYYLPLSPEVLLKIERRPYSDESTESPNLRGRRNHRDFSATEVSMARHIISRDATRFLYGEGTEEQA
ncbi:MAG: DUF4238 domain-containing protein [Chloroflexi bacterium]|nr:DUF4238 domain-containing protein [Chloroflexota bacterium]MCY3938144.1 DUF4238 domain-containing protein [Chloroflexota bacterium]